MNFPPPSLKTIAGSPVLGTVNVAGFPTATCEAAPSITPGYFDDVVVVVVGESVVVVSATVALAVGDFALPMSFPVAATVPPAIRVPSAAVAAAAPPPSAAACGADTGCPSVGGRRPAARWCRCWARSA